MFFGSRTKSVTFIGGIAGGFSSLKLQEERKSKRKSKCLGIKKTNAKVQDPTIYKTAIHIYEKFLTHLTQKRQNEGVRGFEESIGSKSAAIFY